MNNPNVKVWVLHYPEIVEEPINELEEEDFGLPELEYSEEDVQEALKFTSSLLEEDTLNF